MLKLIVCDVDGTLLNYGEEKVNKKILDYIKIFKEKGIVFAVASGRHYSELYNIFKGEDIYYISSDGSCIIKDKEVIYKKYIKENIIEKLKENKNFAFQCPLYTYYKNSDSQFLNILKNKYKENLKELKSSEFIIKIIKYGRDYKEVCENLTQCYKDKDFCEWVGNDVNKGNALLYLQKKLNISKNETAVFGDNFNDISIMRRASKGYAQKDAPYNLKVMAEGIFENPCDIFEKLLREEII